LVTMRGRAVLLANRSTVGVLGTGKRRTTTITLVTMLFLPFMFRQLRWYDSPTETHVRLDCCVAGVLLAHIYHQYENA
jgi:hypothetical protein